MLNLISGFVWIFLGKMRTQDLPSHDSALKIAAGLAFVSEVLGIILYKTLPLSLLFAAAKLAIFGLILYLILKIHAKTVRWRQALTAIFGVQVIVNLLSLPFLPVLIEFMQRAPIDQGAPEVNVSWGLLVVVVLQIWLFALTIRILREAMEISTLRATINTFLLIYLLALAMSLLVGVVPPAPTLIIPE